MTPEAATNGDRMSRIETHGDSVDPYEPHDEHRDLIRRHPMNVEQQLDIEAIIHDKRPDLVHPFLNAMEAARLVADPNIEATARLLADHRGVDWADEEYMDACRRMAEQYVAAALSGDTE